MAKFIQCSCEHTEYKGNKYQNCPINIEHVTLVEKRQYRNIYGNEGTIAIYFHGIEKEWVYGKDETEQRDFDYNKIVNNNYDL